ncbi:hypothetical protein GUJ93_ZPchr0008g13383 [Zizania palustris]|uniref:Uncharacterized protein n=1 Tax=Zizania palustris TaxID=103762 RepID=A0A8J5RAJ8_ZIZPA|nr:hypothetical protein GUJ93_ZPchr0008g13383 [Zizania palustris]
MPRHRQSHRRHTVSAVLPSHNRRASDQIFPLHAKSKPQPPDLGVGCHKPTHSPLLARWGEEEKGPASTFLATTEDPGRELRQRPEPPPER